MYLKLTSIIITSILLIACQAKALLVNPNFLYKQFEKASQNSAVSWWYIGDEGSHQYFAEKYPAKTIYYKVEITQSPFKIRSQNLTYNNELWVNIKLKDLKDLSIN